MLFTGLSRSVDFDLMPEEFILIVGFLNLVDIAYYEV